MIINGNDLIEHRPIHPIAILKQRCDKTQSSWGLSEVGYDVRLAQDVTLNGFKRFKLASTIEKFQMPDNLVGFLHDKSSLIRNMVTIGNCVIEPDWKGFLTLEIMYHGWKPIKLHKGMGIGQVIFHEIKNKAHYVGHYQDQEDRPVESKVIL